MCTVILLVAGNAAFAAVNRNKCNSGYKCKDDVSHFYVEVGILKLTNLCN